MKMKKQALIVLAVLITAFTGCEKLKSLSNFDMPYSLQFTLPKVTEINNEKELSTPDMETNYLSNLNLNSMSSDLVDKIELKSLDLKIDAPTSADFSFLNSIKIYIVATGVDPILIVSKTNIPDNVGNTLKFDVDNSINLKEYVNKDKIGLKIVYTTDKKTTENYTITANVVFTVDPNLFGL